jgi:hypothetical protein
MARKRELSLEDKNRIGDEGLVLVPQRAQGGAPDRVLLGGVRSLGDGGAFDVGGRNLGDFISSLPIGSVLKPRVLRTEFNK